MQSLFISKTLQCLCNVYVGSVYVQICISINCLFPEWPHVVAVRGDCHRADSWSKNCAFNNLRWNFTEVIIKTTKTFLKIWLLSVNFQKFTSIDQWSNQSQPFKHATVIGCCIEVNFWKLTHMQPNFQECLWLFLLSPLYN